MTRGKLTAYAVVAAFIGIICVLGVRSVSGPPLYSGDTLEIRECRRCQGTGKDGSAVCPACVGLKKIQVILPGPKHPVNLRGSVRDSSAFKNQQEAEEVSRAEVGEPSKSLQPLKGAVHESKLVFQGPAKVEIAGQANGRFRCALEPGDYTLTVIAKDFKEYKQSLQVPTLKNPIWLEKGHTKPDDKEAETVFLPILLSR